MNVNSLVPNLIKTPVGAAATGGSILTLIAFTILPPVWPWWSHTDQTWRGAVVSVLGYVLSYLAAWLKLVRTPGQHANLALTSSPLPTIQQVDQPAPESVSQQA
jgi:drug/metabolite transporter (DMT)-like permease